MVHVSLHVFFYFYNAEKVDIVKEVQITVFGYR